MKPTHIALCALAMTACQPAANALQPGPTNTPPTSWASPTRPALQPLEICTPLMPDLDHDTKLQRDFLAMLSYETRGSGDESYGVWLNKDPSTTKIFGYSTEEDSIIYASEQCAFWSPLYND